MSDVMPCTVVAGSREQQIQRFAPATLRAAVWALLSLRRARRLLKHEGLGTRIPSPPHLPAGSVRGVQAVLRRAEPTCLERAIVLQTWLAAHNTAVDIVVGVSSHNGNVTAHAWIDEGFVPSHAAGFKELVRIPPSRIDLSP